jgi:hypothetical protein
VLSNHVASPFLFAIQTTTVTLLFLFHYRKDTKMSVDPALYGDVFGRYCELRNMPTEPSEESLLKRRVTSYEAHIRWCELQISGEQKRNQTIDKLRASIQRTDTKRLECLTLLKLLRNSPKGVVGVDQEKLESEFAQICGFSKVIDLSLESNGVIKVILTARYNMHGTWYDLGDWAITFGARLLFTNKEAPLFLTTEIRTGIRSDRISSGPPVYRIGEGRFCFGDNLSIIKSHMLAGRYPQAIQLISYGLSTITPMHESLVPGTFVMLQEPRRFDYDDTRRLA